MDRVRTVNYPQCEIDFDRDVKQPEYESLAVRVRDSRNRGARALYEETMAIAEAKERFSGSFHAFLGDPRVNLEPRMAQHYVKIAHAPDGFQLAKLGVAKAIQMLRLDPEQRREIFAEKNPDGLSVADLKQLVNQYRAPMNSRKVRASASYRAEVWWSAGVLQLDWPITRLDAEAVEKAYCTIAQALHIGAEGTFFDTLAKAKHILEGAIRAGKPAE